MVVASDLLLCGAFGICLNVRVKQATSVTHILDSSTRSIGNLKGAIFSDLSASQVCLE